MLIRISDSSINGQVKSESVSSQQLYGVAFLVSLLSCCLGILCFLAVCFLFLGEETALFSSCTTSRAVWWEDSDIQKKPTGFGPALLVVTASLRVSFTFLRVLAPVSSHFRPHLSQLLWDCPGNCGMEKRRSKKRKEHRDFSNSLSVL